MRNVIDAMLLNNAEAIPFAACEDQQWWKGNKRFLGALLIVVD